MRLKISVQLNDRALNIKLMVFQEESWRKIEDLENHIKRLFNLGDLQLELFVEDFWIPSTENIGVIRSIDEVIVREASTITAVKFTSANKVTANGKDIKKQPKYCKKETTSEEELLSSKKQELLSKVVSLEEDEMDVTDFGAMSPKKRKRKRKHKKSSKIPLLAGITPDVIQNPPSEPASAERTELASTQTILRVGHIRFDHDHEEDMDISVPNSREDRSEDWQQKLLSLAQERNKVVFTRQLATNGMNGVAHLESETSSSRTEAENLETSVAVTYNLKHVGSNDLSSRVSACLPMGSPKTSDLMYFKKLIMENSIPTVSDFMLAVVEEVGEDNVLTLKICEGHTEQTFSAEELQESEGDTFIVKLDWTKILEPHLVIDQSLMSKYL